MAKSSRRKPLLRILIAFLIILVGVGLYGGLRVWRFMGNVYNDVPESLLEDKPQENEPINILFMGIDHNPGRTDTIIMVSFNPTTEKLLIMSIPRDTQALIPGYYRNTQTPYGVQKINHAHAYGSIPLTLRTVENFLGVNFHYYARVDYTALHKIVDAIGGVPVNVPFNMNYVDNAGGLTINLRAGEQTLNGKKAEEFLRWRQNSDGTGDGRGDIGRVERQQMFINSAIKQLMKPSNLLKINVLEEIIVESVNTNIPPSYMLELFREFAVGFDFDSNMQILTVPGDYSTNGANWIVEGENLEEMNSVIQKHMVPGISEEITVKVYSSIDNQRLSNRVVDRLNTYAHINAVYAGKHDKQLPLTEVISYTDSSIASYVASIVNSANNIYLGKDNEDVDIVIIIGEDLDI
jgi:LCP family protein required for cell wall assembly